MRELKWGRVRGAWIGVLGVMMVVGAQAEIDLTGLQEVPPAQVPRIGTFYWAKRNLPPLPCPPGDLNVPIYRLTDDKFVIDDTGLPENSTMAKSRTSLLLSPLEEGLKGEDSGYLPDNRRAFVKFAQQEFEYLSTNSIEDPLLASLVTNFPPSSPGPTLQVLPYGTNALVIKASHFDYSAESRNFALIVSDSVGSPIWKSVDLQGASDAQDGWVIQGTIPSFGVADPMYFMISNLYPRQAFFAAIPYSGPRISVTDAPAPGAAVSNNISLHLGISDLSGTSNALFVADVDGLDARYTVGLSNLITLDSRYANNGNHDINFRVYNYNATIYAGATNMPSDTPYTFNSTTSVALDFENGTYVYFANDNASPEIGTNFILYGVTPPADITAVITEPASGRWIRGFAGSDPDFNLIQLDWDFTDSDGTSPYTNETYAVTFTASNSPNNVVTLQMTNRVQHSGVRGAHWVINEWEEMGPRDFNPRWYAFYSQDAHIVNNQTKMWQETAETMYETLYYDDFASQSSYFSYQIGVGRDNPTSNGNPLSIFPFNLTPNNETGWKALLESWLTNSDYSDFNWSGHGNEIVIGGGVYPVGSFFNHINTFVTTAEVYNWARAVPTHNWRIRKAAMWSCESGHDMVPANLPTGVNPGPGYWPNALGIYSTPQQLNSLQDKNCGLFFDGDVYFDPPGTHYGSGSGAGPAYLPEVAAAFEKYWVMGQYPFPGGADPNYSMQFAFGQVLQLYPELIISNPKLVGYPLLPYSGMYDDELRVLDHHQVVQ